MGQIKLRIPPPHEKQEEFFKARARYISYGGARAGGKSWAMRVKFVLLCLRYEGIQTLLLRRTLPELTENHVNPLLSLLKGIAVYNKQEKVFRFPNGARIKLGYCANETDVLQYQGQAYDVIGMEEATMFTEFQYNCLRESNRSSGMMKETFSPRMYLTMNPGGVGHAWVKRLFIDRDYIPPERAEDYVFIPARVYDNKAFMQRDPDYVHQLESLPEKRKRAMLYGDWDVFEGAYFEEFRTSPDPKRCEEYGITTEEALKRHKFTHVIEPFPIPSDWKIYRSFDWGYGKPYSVGYHALSNDNVAYRIAEIYGWNGRANEGCHETNKQICDRIAAFERTHPYLAGKRIRGVADPSCWTKNGGISFAEEAEKHSLWFEKGNNDRIPGWMQVRERMRFDENGKAMLYFFNTCTAMIRCMPLMMYDKHYVEDLDSTLEDHCLDELRYFAMSRPIPPRNIAEKTYYAVDPLEQFEKTRKKGYFGG
jgi:phage terminase large subunit